MDQFLFLEKPENERKLSLESISDGVEEMSFARYLSQEELAERRTQLTNLVIKKAEIDDRKKEAMAEFKAELEPVNDEISEVLTEIKAGSVRETGITYKIINYETSEVGFYNEKGQLVHQRPMVFEDRQRVFKMAANE